MDDPRLALFNILPVVFPVLILVLLVLMAVRRRRASESSGAVVSSGRRRIVDTVLSSARRPHGRHSAELAASPGVLLLLLVPTATKRRRRPLDGSDVTLRDVTLVHDPMDGESDGAEIVVPELPVAQSENRGAIATAAPDIRTYRRRVETTIQAMSRRIEPGEPPESIEARMLAAMERLDGPLDFVRPKLSPACPRRPRAQLARTSQTASPIGLTALPSGEVETEPPFVDAPPPADPPSESAFHAEDSEAAQPKSSAHEEAEVVLPVPLLASPDNARRRGLRRRRGKAG